MEAAVTPAEAGGDGADSPSAVPAAMTPSRVLSRATSASDQRLLLEGKGEPLRRGVRSLTRRLCAPHRATLRCCVVVRAPQW
jgi:hypothetical protein